MKIILRAVCFLLPVLGLAGASQPGDMIVNVERSRLVVIHLDGSSELISDKPGQATFSPDRRFIAFTRDQQLLVLNLATHATDEIVQLPEGARFAQVEWAPNGKAIAYEVIARGKSDDLFIAPLASQRGQPRNLGHWYQGFSFSPDGSRIVHAINLPFALETVDTTSGVRTILHKAGNVVWTAQFSPDGKYIAYTQTVTPPGDPSQSADDDEDCANPPNELHLLSLVDGSDTTVKMHDPQAPSGVYHFAWSPDSRRIALELGTPDCGYPTGDAAVFVTSVDQKDQLKISNESASYEPVFSPDGSGVVFMDASHDPVGLWRYDLAGKSLKPFTVNGIGLTYEELLQWK
jgi:Tol biopolymer transport system component